jgi:hypothetical protein
MVVVVMMFWVLVSCRYMQSKPRTPSLSFSSYSLKHLNEGIVVFPRNFLSYIFMYNSELEKKKRHSVAENCN